MDTIKFSSAMTAIASLLFMFLAVSSALDMSLVSHGSPRRTDEDVKAMFESWLVEHGKNYNAIGEKEVRYQIFKDNLRKIDEHNSVERTYKVGLNLFSDLTLEEYRSNFLGELPDSPASSINGNRTAYEFKAADDIPDYVDWREKGAVAPVQNQGKCGGCWAFATAGAVEGINQIRTGKLVKLSEQHLIDCDYNNRGCNGGNREWALDFVLRNGLASEESYPFTGSQGSCKYPDSIVFIDDYAPLKRNDEENLKLAVYTQPISAGMDAHNQAFKDYKSGIYDGPCGTTLGHAVLIVGYGTEKGVDYWLVKNTWGEKWGEKGYFRMRRNTGGSGKCGIATSPCFPIKNPNKKIFSS